MAAISAVFLFPEQTATNFAWTIPAVVMAAVIGAFYLATGFLFALELLARSWEHVRVIVLPAVVFTTLELLVTVLHWNRFNQGTLPFYVWFAVTCSRRRSSRRSTGGTSTAPPRSGRA